VALLVVPVLAVGCVKVANPSSPDRVVSIPDSGTLVVAQGFCVDEVNRLRATAGLRSLSHSSGIDAFSTTAAQTDGEAHQAHMYFHQTNGGNGVALAENMIPWWKETDHGSVQTIISQGLAMMWAEGPGGSHYNNMTGTFSEVGCGVFVSPAGEVTVSQDFR
jgi:hypothetical protein